MGIEEMMHDEAVRVSKAMIKYGGSFVEHLGYALEHADMKNTMRIKHAFPDYWEEYKAKSMEPHIDSVSSEDWERYMRKSAQAVR